MAEGSDNERGIPEPPVIASHLYRAIKQAIPNVTQWDLICFSAEMLASAATTNPDVFKAVAVRAMDIVYTIHEHHKDGIESCLKSQVSQTSPQLDGLMNSSEFPNLSVESPSRMDVLRNQLALEFPPESLQEL